MTHRAVSSGEREGYPAAISSETWGTAPTEAAAVAKALRLVEPAAVVVPTWRIHPEKADLWARVLAQSCERCLRFKAPAHPWGCVVYEGCKSGRPLGQALYFLAKGNMAS